MNPFVPGPDVDRFKTSRLIEDGEKNLINSETRQNLVENFLMDYPDRDVDWRFNEGTRWLMIEVRVDKKIPKKDMHDFTQRLTNVIAFGEL